MTNQEQAEQLLNYIREETDKRCQALYQKTQAQCQEIITKAYQQARDKVHHAVAAERELLNDEVRSQKAELQTQRRLYQQQRQEALLVKSRQTLIDSLKQRWQDPEKRQAWIDKALHDAYKKIPGKQWQITCDCLSSSEQTAIKDAVKKNKNIEASFMNREGLSAGLIISSQGVIIDASLEGLLKDRARIQARLLALIDSASEAVNQSDSQQENA